MAKANEYYNLISSYGIPGLKFLAKKDRFDDQYHYHELPTSSTLPYFKIDGRKERAVSHHLSFYKYIREDVGYGSHYSYLKFEMSIRFGIIMVFQI